jgi:dipeptidyl aminopeptidase/acylaminoacyl peptidase
MRKIFGISFLIFVFTISISILAQEPYKLPPKDVIDIVNAPLPPQAIMSPTGNKMLLAEYEVYPSIEYMAQPMLRLAGMRLLPKNNSRQQTTFVIGLSIKNLANGSTINIDLPEDAKLSRPQWSFDDKWVAFTRYLDNGIELWLVDAETGKAQAITPAKINATLNQGFGWTPDNRHIIAHMIPVDRGDPPKKPAVPMGPRIWEAYGKTAKVWTYQDLLKDPYDEELFDYYTTSQIVEIDVQTGQSRNIGKPAIYYEATPSPDGKYLLVYEIKRPFSYSVPYYYFTHTLEIWNRDGEMVHPLADLPLADEVPMRGVPTGIRNAEWYSAKPATLIWSEALDEGDPNKEVPHRDKLITLAAPFKEEANEVMKVTHRYWWIFYLNAEEAFITEYDWKKRWRTTYLINVEDKDIAPRKIFDLSIHERYKDPGRPVFDTTKIGGDVLLQDGDWIYLSGRGASPEGDRPFLDRMNTKTVETERLFHCGEKSYESFVGFVRNSRSEIITSYQSNTEPPNYYYVNLKTEERKILTDYKDPAPQLTGMKKQLLKYKREDGVELSGTLYLPPDYKEGDRLPLVIWAYPIEYSDPSVAGQVQDSPYRFTFFRGYSQLFFVTQGYVVLDRAQMPVIGDPKTMNDTFVQQIVSNVQAAIDKLDSMGIIDPKRVGVGGHSYGAFMTANLLAHCDLLSAGIARSGAYNRTLTPFGFQNERRTLWEDHEIYFKVSPFMHAHKINEPILLIHGMIDNNSGTYPIQSERLFHALKGHGAFVRLVMLPHESHGYRAQESILHVLAEMFEWFDKYVKNKK